MKINGNTRILSFFLLLLLSFALLVSASLAWFTTFINAHYEEDFYGSSIAAYFAEGDGTEAHPYVINDSRHLYNLAWLQNQEPPVFTKETHFAVCQSWPKEAGTAPTPITLDMGGKIGGADTGVLGGAIPPIGTKDAPFIGHFDGCGSIIKNLWVSTEASDWKEQPHGENEYVSTHVGLFGAVGGDAIIENFVLDTVEVKSHYSSTLGIICGYVDANVKNVGVYNAILNISDGATCNSKYSLLGEKSDRVIWEDMPEIDPDLDSEGNVDIGGDDAGGVIRIDINDGKLVDIFTGGGTIGNNKEKALGSDYKEITEEFVEDVAPKRSYLVGDVTASAHQKYTAFYIYATSISSRTGYTDGVKTVRGSTKGDITDSTNQDFESFVASTYYNDYQENGNNVLADREIVFNQDFYTRLTDFPTAPKVIKTGAAPINADTKEISTIDIEFDDNADSLPVPANGIWFKPMGEGPSIISFSISDKGGGEKYRSIYRYKRNQDGTINTDSWTETKLVFLSDFLNCDVVAFQYYIEKADVEEGYEFLIGTTSDDNNSGSVSFVFLALAGASNAGGGDDGETGGDGEEETTAEMCDVDYVISPSTNVADANYKNHNTLLKITDATNTKIYYLAARTEDTADLQDPSIVYYYQTGVSALKDISRGQQSASAAWGAELGIDKSKFKDRDKSTPT